MEKKYQTVTDTIQQWITSSQYHENDKLPTESALMTKFDVSRHTVRKALGDLESNGFVYRVQGGGTYVAERRARPVAAMESVAVMTTHINDYIFPSIISGVERVLSAQSVSLMLSSTENKEDVEAKTLSKMMSSAINGLIVEPTHSAFTIKNEAMYAQLQQSHVPIITINARFKDLQTPYFVMDDFQGGKMATEYILQHHHSRILGVFKSDDQQGIDRMNGFVSAIQKANRPATVTTLMYQSGKAEARVGDRLRQLFTQQNRPTAMVCYNDQIAVLAYNIAQTMGIQVPEDLSIIGFDNSSLASSLGLHLTSVDHPKATMGRDAATLMLRMIQNPNKDFLDESKTYSPELVIGESVVDAQKQGGESSSKVQQ